MVKFCNSCNNIIVVSTEKNKLLFYCKLCNKYYDSKPEDTLLKEENIKNYDILYKSKTYLQSAHNDILAPLVKKECEKCKAKIVRYVSIYETGNLIYICQDPECKNMTF